MKNLRCHFTQDAKVGTLLTYFKTTKMRSAMFIAPSSA